MLDNHNWNWINGVEQYSAKFLPDASGGTIAWTVDVDAMDDERGYGQHRESQQSLADFLANGPNERAPQGILDEMVAYFASNRVVWLDGLRFQQPAMNGDTAAVRTMLKEGVPPDVLVLGSTPFYWAIKNQHLETANVLFEAGVQVNRHFGCENNMTALMLVAAYANDDSWVALTQKLIATGAGLEAVDTWGQTALIHSASGYHNGTLSVMRVLIQSGANVNAVSKNGYTPLIEEAFSHGRREGIKLLLDAGANVNARDKTDWSGLMWAIAQGHIDAVRALIAAGADVNIVGQGHNQFEKPRRLLQVAQDYARVPEGWAVDEKLKRAAEIVRLVQEARAK